MQSSTTSLKKAGLYHKALPIINVSILSDIYTYEKSQKCLLGHLKNRKIKKNGTETKKCSKFKI